MLVLGFSFVSSFSGHFLETIRKKVLLFWSGLRIFHVDDYDDEDNDNDADDHDNDTSAFIGLALCLFWWLFV